VLQPLRPIHPKKASTKSTPKEVGFLVLLINNLFSFIINMTLNVRLTLKTNPLFIKPCSRDDI
jgi:hypothetical protein